MTITATIDIAAKADEIAFDEVTRSVTEDGTVDFDTIQEIVAETIVDDFGIDEADADRIASTATCGAFDGFGRGIEY